MDREPRRAGGLDLTTLEYLRRVLPNDPNDAMADPFEVRMRFTSQLQHLNASVTSSQKAAQYALKYKDMNEDLHSCILEQLERNSMNNRANILYFLEVLCDMSVAAQSVDYVRMIQRDILRVVDAVAPEDGSGAANIKVVRKVLQGLQNKGHLSKQTVDEIEECLRERDAALAVGGVGVGMSSPMEGVEGQGEGEVQIHGTGTRTGERDPATQQQQVLSRSQSRMSMAGKLDKKQVEQRIEEDRERHKRLRENQWATPSAAAGDDDAEFDQLYDETSSLASDDYRVFEEEALQREECAALQLEEMAALEAGKGAE